MSSVKPIVSQVAIIGFGLMGAQIAQVFAQNGFQVNAYDVSEPQLRGGMDLVKNGKYGLSSSVTKGRMTQEQANEAFAKITLCTSMKQALAEADLVLEAAIEDLAIKHGIFKSAVDYGKPSAILASNTSTLSIARISEKLNSARNRVIGMHFFNPPQVMKLVEVVRTKATTEKIVRDVISVATSLGKIPISVLDSPGFVANRIGLSVFADASFLLEKGVASVRDIDLAMRLGYGYPMGPFELGDLVGLDARLRNMESMYEETKDERFKPPEILRKLVAEGFVGDTKTKKGSKGGYYEYFGLKKPSEEL
jgi:3-hydroxybutyryl-CoA dehydrogenase